MISLKKYSDIAHNILNNESRYKSNKNIISTLFNDSIKEGEIEVVKNRLTIIDCYYSTQMNKRLYGIEQMSELLSCFSDIDLQIELNQFLKSPKEGEIFDLFNIRYGLNKEGKSEKKAISLLSKYFYFLYNYSFPIYDSLAFDSYSLIKKNIDLPIVTLKEENYFTSLIHLNTISGINNFEKLDNLLWLLGKLKKGSFSILMNIEQYKRITSIKEIVKGFEKINEGNNKNKSSLKDKVIRQYIKNYYNKSELFNVEEKHFFEFAFDLI